MNKFLLCAASLLTALSGFAQGVKIQAFTTNTAPVVTNIVIGLSSNLQPNRLSATNTVSGLRVYAATNGNGGFWLDPTTITPGQATNVIDVAAGTSIFVTTNSLLRTISTASVQTNDTRALTLSNRTSEITIRHMAASNISGVGTFALVITNAQFNVVNRPWTVNLADGTEVVKVSQSIGQMVGIFAGDGGGLTNITTTGGNGTFSGTFTGNALGLTNGSIQSVHDLFDPPRIAFNVNPYPGIIKPSDFYLAAAPGVSGIIRDLSIQPDLSVGTHDFINNMHNINLRIYPDCGSDTNPPLAGALAFDVPLADLFGNRFRYLTNGQWAIQRHSQFIDCTDFSTNSIYQDPIHMLRLKLPIYFTNGCLIKLFQTVGNTNWPHGYINAYVERGTLDRLGEWKTWRLRSRNISGPFGGSLSNFMFSVATPGLAAGITEGFFDNTESGVVSTFLDTRGPNFADASGNVLSGYGDDFYGNTYGHIAGLDFGRLTGVVNYWLGPNVDAASQATEVYRWFLTDGPWWTNSLTVSYWHPSSTSPALVDHSATFIFYGP